MLIPDLTKLPNLNPYSFVGSTPIGMFMDELYDQSRFGAKSVYAVGWLGNQVHKLEKVASKYIDRLFKKYTSEHIISDFTKGWHICEICTGKESWYKEDNWHWNCNG